MSRPDEIPSWCDDDSPSKIVEPSAGKKLSGWLYKERVAFQYWNWTFRNFVKWFLHIDSSVNHFDCYASATPDEFINITAGKISDGVSVISKSLQQIDYTSFMPTGGGTSRIDVIVIDNLTGVVSRVAGTAGGSPTVPAVPVGLTALCQIIVTSADTTIKTSMITDYRVFANNIQLIDEDDMSSDSDKVAPTQQSLKAYVPVELRTAFTPDLQGGSTAGTPVGGFTGYYVRSGPIAIIDISINLTSKGGMVGVISLIDLPFTFEYTPLNQKQHAGIVGNTTGLNSGDNVYVQTSGTGDRLDLVYQDPALDGGALALTDTLITDTFTWSGRLVLMIKP